MRHIHLLSIVVMLIFVATETVAAEGKASLCGKATVSLSNSSIKTFPFYVLNIKVSGLEYHYLYGIEREIFMLRCEASATGKMYILFNWMCGGSGCNEAGFGLVDADTGKIRLKPKGRWRRDGNADKASKILGHPVQAFSCPAFSRASTGVLKSTGELCFLPLLDSPV